MMVLRLDVEKEPVLVIGKLFPQDEEKLGIKVVYFDDTDDCVEVLASHMRKGGTTVSTKPGRRGSCFA